MIICADGWEEKENASHIIRISKDCNISIEEASQFYNKFVIKKILYHYPEDSRTLKLVIDTFNYLKYGKV